jgi:Uma2 family endonuclease
MAIASITNPQQHESASIPPLHTGDRLTRDEFHRRYSVHPHLSAELLEGVVYVSSPLYTAHIEPHSRINFWAVGYQGGTPGIRVADNTSIQLDAFNEVQPDVCLWVGETHGGRVHVTAQGLLEGAPEFIIEIASSSAAYDLHDKLEVYRRNGVQEYLVLLAHEQTTVWYRLHGDLYRTVEPDRDGVLRSKALPGLWFHPEHFWTGDVFGLLSVLQSGMETGEHAGFVERLRAAANN